MNEYQKTGAHEHKTANPRSLKSKIGNMLQNFFSGDETPDPSEKNRHRNDYFQPDREIPYNVIKDIIGRAKNFSDLFSHLDYVADVFQVTTPGYMDQQAVNVLKHDINLMRTGEKDVETFVGSETLVKKIKELLKAESEKLSKLAAASTPAKLFESLEEIKEFIDEKGTIQTGRYYKEMTIHLVNQSRNQESDGKNNARYFTGFHVLPQIGGLRNTVIQLYPEIRDYVIKESL